MMLMLVPIVSHDQETNAALHFDNLDQRNVLIPLTALYASHDADALTNGITWARRSCCTSLLSSWSKKYGGATYDTVSFMWHWHWCQWHQLTPTLMLSCDAYGSGNCGTWQKSHVAPHFDCLDVRNEPIPLTMHADGSMWSQHQC